MAKKLGTRAAAVAAKTPARELRRRVGDRASRAAAKAVTVRFSAAQLGRHGGSVSRTAKAALKRMGQGQAVGAEATYRGKYKNASTGAKRRALAVALSRMSVSKATRTSGR
jgi:type IV secretory pathway VirJ component|tara:strand:+ start:290 stop:622 length:333 start_codon:yes stop_codon:yes gene_type:complete